MERAQESIHYLCMQLTLELAPLTEGKYSSVETTLYMDQEILAYCDISLQ
jgi:hypothetical protein